MRPNQVAQALRQIAVKIENSKSPKRQLVAKDLKRVLIAMDQFPEIRVKIESAYQELKNNPKSESSNIGLGSELFPDVDAVDEVGWHLERSNDHPDFPGQIVIGLWSYEGYEGDDIYIAPEDAWDVDTATTALIEDMKETAGENGQEKMGGDR